MGLSDLVINVGKDGFPPLRVALPLKQKDCRRCGGTHFDTSSPNLKLGAKTAFPNSDGVGLSDLIINVGKAGFPPLRGALPLLDKAKGVSLR